MDGRTDGRSETNIPPNNFVVWGGYKDPHYCPLAEGMNRWLVDVWHPHNRTVIPKVFLCHVIVKFEPVQNLLFFFINNKTIPVTKGYFLAIIHILTTAEWPFHLILSLGMWLWFYMCNFQKCCGNYFYEHFQCFCLYVNDTGHWW